MNTLQPTPRVTRRGQALILSALGMVLLVLMVCMTLSFGTKAKQKMEVQLVADQAAYSTAVAVARTYNVLSMVNRVMIAHMVAMIGIQSAISFTGSWVTAVQIMFLGYTAQFIQEMACCSWTCYGCVSTGPLLFARRLVPLIKELLRIKKKYKKLDKAAADEVRNTGRANIALYLGQLEAVSMQLYGSLNNQSVARKVMGKASAGIGDWQVANGGADVAMREAGFLFGSRVALGTGAINESNLILTDRHAVVAAMASRGHFFTANRSTWLLLNGVKSIMDSAFKRVKVDGDFQGIYFHMGHGYFGATYHSDATLVTMSTYAMADDHGFGMLQYSGFLFTSKLPIPALGVSFVRSNNTNTSQHFAGIFGDSDHQVPAWCLVNCPSAWSNFVDYNPVLVADKGDNYAQPKSPVTVYRDASLSNPDPFNLFFNFRFSSTGSGATLDMKHGAGANGGALTVRDGAGGTADISRQMGYSTGITYYHRAGHWAEPPNLFNAYWRAGITRPDTDRGAKIINNSNDIENTLSNSGAGWAANAYDALYSVGYQGIAP